MKKMKSKSSKQAQLLPVLWSRILTRNSLPCNQGNVRLVSWEMHTSLNALTIPDGGKAFVFRETNYFRSVICPLETSKSQMFSLRGQGEKGPHRMGYIFTQNSICTFWARKKWFH